VTNFDILVTILSESTGHTVGHWAHVVRTSLAAGGVDIATHTKLLDEVPDDEAKQQLNALRKEKAGIFSWLVAGAVKSQGMKPSEKTRIGMFLNNAQN
jgi:hypothetical protein